MKQIFSLALALGLAGFSPLLRAETPEASLENRVSKLEEHIKDVSASGTTTGGSPFSSKGQRPKAKIRPSAQKESDEAAGSPAKTSS